jgi:acyl-coenzyme A thioesterase PaaI-like protein
MASGREPTVEVTEIPFNRFLGIQRATDGESRLLELPDDPNYANHVGTLHAGAQMALAEAASGECLIRAMPGMQGQAFAVVRRVEAKFKSPMKGRVVARSASSQSDIQQAAGPLSTKGRAMIPVTVEIVDGDGAVGLIATFEWFAQMIPVPKRGETP